MPNDFSSISPTLAARHVIIKLPSGAVKNLVKHVDTAGWSSKLLDVFHQPSTLLYGPQEVLFNFCLSWILELFLFVKDFKYC